MKKGTFFIALVIVSQVISACTHKSTPAITTVSNEAIPPLSREPGSELEGTPWTDWSEKGKVLDKLMLKSPGLLVLKNIRENMLENNLHDPHVNYSGYKNIDCSKVDTRFRAADGTCNDVKRPYVGAAGVAFGRNVAPKYIDRDAAEKLMIPDPALVSKEFFTRDQFKPVPFLNMLAAVWIQFMNHDWLTHGRNTEKDPYKVDGAEGEKRFVERTKENTLNSNQYKGSFGKTTINDVTHWWDASQIYGSNLSEQYALRSFSRGKMRLEKVNGRELLPKRKDLNVADNKQNQGYENTGFKDNWWVGLSMLHTLFVREHNAIADMLMKKHVTYSNATKMFTWKNGDEVLNLDEKGLDAQIFGTARLINAAVLAKIHTVEWTPAILPNPVLKMGMYSNWYGLANPTSWSKVLAKIPGLNKTDYFAGKDLGYLVGGIVGDHTDDFGVPFSITEEFTSVYRLHSLLPENLNLRHLSQKGKAVAVPFLETRNEKSYPIMASYDTKDLFYSFGVQLPGQLVANNFPKFMQHLPIPGHGVMDLGMVDIIRDRERGVPRYNQFRRAIGLKPIKSYRDFFPAKKLLDARQVGQVKKFYEVYGRDEDGNDNVEMIDLLVGTLSEEVRPENFGFGETQFQIFILMASRRLMADRFFTADYNPKHYTQAGMDWIDHEGTFGQVIVRHMPELAANVKGLETAFLPWNK